MAVGIRSRVSGPSWTAGLQKRSGRPAAQVAARERIGEEDERRSERRSGSEELGVGVRDEQGAALRRGGSLCGTVQMRCDRVDDG